jgi:hypothetical protein
MRERYLRLLFLATALCALAAAPARGYIANDWWRSTATNPSPPAPPAERGTPVTVTWSFAPDGTNIPSATSGLIGFLDLHWGPGEGGDDYTLRPWFTYFDQAFARLGQLAGVTYAYEPNDDGATFASLTRGELGVRGDMRLSGKSYGPGDPTLAATFFPDYAEMMVNTDQVSHLTDAGNNFRWLRNTLMHESMHALGISHVDSSDARFLIEPSLLVTFDGPQLDDILALQRLYGDVLEKNGGNDAATAATPLGALSEGAPLIRGTFGDSTIVAGTAMDFLSVDDDSDVDYFSFTLSEPLAVTIGVSPKGTTYMVGPVGGTQTSFNSRAASDLSLALFDAEGGVQLGPTANSTGAGLGESIVRELNPGTYLARVAGAHDEVQLYQISLSGAAIAVEYAPADFNEDGLVDGDDLDVWRVGLGLTAGALHTQGDANGDFAVDGSDFLIWQRGLNNSGNARATSLGVPEPTSLVAALAAMGAAYLRRRSARSLG